MKKRKNKDCQCSYPIGNDARRILKSCKFGFCTILLCPWCGMIDAEWGPVECPHKKNENGTLRWYRYPEMDKKKPVPRGKLRKKANMRKQKPVNMPGYF